MSCNTVSLENYPSLQSAIDAVPEYGTLFVPPGIWNCGAGQLKSNMTLFLAKGARLVAPATLEEHVTCRGFNRSCSLSHAFLELYKLENVTIAGEGILDCQGHLFWKDYDHAPDVVPDRNPVSGRYALKQYLPMPFRPVGIMATQCTHIKLENITVFNASSYTIWTLGCEHLRLNAVKVDNIRRGPNTDALDIDCCSDVWITNCHLRAGDDCIAIKSDIALLGFNKTSERIHVANNTMTSQCCGVRIGYEGDGAIRDVIFTDNIIYDSNIGFDVLSVLPEVAIFNIKHGSPIENIQVNNMIIRNVRQAIKLWNYADNPERLDELTGYIRNVSLCNMYIEAVSASFIGGAAVSDIHLENIKMHVKRLCRRSEAGEPVNMPTVWGDGYLPDPLTIYQVKNLTMENVRVTEEYPG